jgi:hypothetical protein
MSTTFITSHLLMGDRPAKISRPVIDVANADGAIRVLDEGKIALLPRDAWDQAERVLRHYGCDIAHVRFQLAVGRGDVRVGPVD